MTQLIIYTTDHSTSQIQLRADLGTVWLTQLEMVRWGYDGRATS